MVLISTKCRLEITMTSKKKYFVIKETLFALEIKLFSSMSGKQAITSLPWLVVCSSVSGMF